MEDPVPVTEPLSPANAGFLELELEKQGIASRTREAEPGAVRSRQIVEVAPSDLTRAKAIAEALAAEEQAAAPPPSPRRRRRRWTRALVAALLGMVAVGRLGRILHATGTAFLALTAAVGIVAMLFAVGSADEDDPKGRPGPRETSR